MLSVFECIHEIFLNVLPFVKGLGDDGSVICIFILICILPVVNYKRKNIVVGVCVLLQNQLGRF